MHWDNLYETSLNLLACMKVRHGVHSPQYDRAVTYSIWMGFLYARRGLSRRAA